VADKSVKASLGNQFKYLVLESFRETLDGKLDKLVQGFEKYRLFWDLDTQKEFFKTHSLEFKPEAGLKNDLGAETSGLIDDLDTEMKFELQRMDWRNGLGVTVVKHQKENINDFAIT